MSICKDYIGVFYHNPLGTMIHQPEGIFIIWLCEAVVL